MANAPLSCKLGPKEKDLQGKRMRYVAGLTISSHGSTPFIHHEVEAIQGLKIAYTAPQLVKHARKGLKSS
jgi:hypothetical protein